jgi:hypothetical protein
MSELVSESAVANSIYILVSRLQFVIDLNPGFS